MRRARQTITAAAALLLAPVAALAQTAPNWTYGYVPTTAQWNAIFASKQDTLGYVPMNVAGGSFTGRVVTAAPGASTAGLNLTPGVTPSAPLNGDLWITSAAVFARVGGATVNLTSGGGIMPDGLGSPPCVRGGGNNCTSGVQAAANAAAAAGLPMHLGYPGGYCITPMQFGGGSPPAGVTLAGLPFGITTESVSSAFVSCSPSPTGNAMVTIVNYSAGSPIVPNFYISPMIIDGSTNNSYALEVYGSVYSNIQVTPRGGSVASVYLRADNTHVVTNNSWAFMFDTASPGISVLMRTTDGATDGIAMAVNRCVVSNPYGTASGDVVQTSYVNGGCKVDAESSTGGYGVNIGHTSNGVWEVYTEGNGLGGVGGTANTKGVQIVGSSQDGIAAALKSCGTCSVDVWNLTSSTQERNFGDAVGQSVYLQGIPGVTTPSVGQGWAGAGSTYGAQFSGNGVTNDFTVLDSRGFVACGLPHNTAIWNCSGFQINSAAPLNHIMLGDGSAYRDSATLPTSALSGTLQAAQEPAHTGDVTNTAGSLALTLATVNSNVGTFGSATQVPQLTVNGKGLITAVASVTISGVSPGGSAGGDLTGTYPSPTLAAIITAGGPTGSATVAPIITYDAKGRLTAVSSAPITPAVGSITGLGTGVAAALAIATGSAGGVITFNGPGGTPSSIALTNATSFPFGTGGTGQVPLANGGLAANLTASNGGMFYSTGSAGAILAGTATARQMLQSGASGPPAWSTATWPATTTANQLLYSSATNTVGGLATANSAVLVTDGTGIPSLSTTLPNIAHGTPTSINLTNATALPYTALPALSANQVLGALTATTPSGLSVPSCSTAGSAIQWTSGTGWGCKTGVFSTSNAAMNALPADPTGTTSTAGVMMGLGTSCTITPVNSTRVKMTIYGQINNNTAGVGSFFRMGYGTGTAPANGAATTGTFFGSAATIVNGGGGSVGFTIPFNASGNATGLTTGTAYWFDVRVGAVSSGTASVISLNCSAEEA